MKKRTVSKKKSDSLPEKDDSFLRMELKRILEGKDSVLDELKRLNVLSMPSEIPQSRKKESLKNESENDNSQDSDCDLSNSSSVKNTKVDSVMTMFNPLGFKKPAKLEDPVNIPDWQGKLFDYLLTNGGNASFSVISVLKSLTCLKINNASLNEYLSDLAYEGNDKKKMTDEKPLYTTDVILFTTNWFELGFFCTDVYSSEMKPLYSVDVSLTLKNGNSLLLGESRSGSSTTVKEPKTDINISAVRDSSGVVYSIKKGVSKTMIDEYITDGSIGPSNESEQIKFDDDDETENGQERPAYENVEEKDWDFTCYSRGFLIFASTDENGKKITMLWMNEPLRIRVKNNSADINDMFKYNAGTLDVDLDKMYELPKKSGFFKTNKLFNVPSSFDILATTSE